MLLILKGGVSCAVLGSCLGHLQGLILGFLGGFGPGRVVMFLEMVSMDFVFTFDFLFFWRVLEFL